MLSKQSANRFARLAVVCLALAGACTNGQLDGDESEVAVASAALTAADCPVGYNVIQGDDNANVLNGTAGNDCIVGLGGNDTINGFAGTDFLIGGLGDDTLNGGDGNDTLHGEEGIDRLDGQNDDDSLYGGIAADKLYGGPGNDFIDAGNSNDIVEGGTGNDVLYGNIGIDTIRGGDGDDRLFGDASNDFLYGDAGNDVLNGGADNDQCSGGDGNDVITGSTGNDVLSGEAGNDFIADTTGTNTIDGGSDSDSCTGANCELAAPTVNACTLASQCNSAQTCVADTGMCVPCGTVGGSGCNNTVDNCPSDPNKYEPGICGCGVADTDGDGDGTADCNDACAADPNKTAAGICGCGTADGDSDGDGAINCNEACPSDPNKTTAGICGCGVADTDGNANGFADCIDGPSAALTAANCPGGYNVIQGDANPNTLNGTAGSDCIVGLGGDDTINGLGGNDFLVGGAGNDTIYGGDGNDTMYGEDGADRLEGQNGDDRMYGGIAADRLYGGAGNDWGHAGNSNDIVEGGTGNDVLYGGAAVDTISGNDGDDRLFGDAGGDFIYGNAGNDVLSGGADNDQCFGGNNNDVITGGTGNDVLNGEAGNDSITDTSGTNTIDGGPDTDSCTGANCESGSPTISGCTVASQCSTGQTCVTDVGGMCLPCGSAGGVGCNDFVPVLLNESDKSSNVHLSDDELELRISNTQNDGGVRSTEGVASGSGVWYFEMSQIGITGNGFFGAGVGTATAALDQTIGSSTQSVGMTGGGIIWYDGNFITNAGHSDTIGFVVDYRGANPIVHIIAYEWDVSAVRHKRTLPVTAPVFAMFVGQAAHHGEIARFNFGSDTENHPFVHDPIAALTTAGDASVASALVLGWGRTRALPHSAAPVLTTDADSSIAVNTPITLHASATDAENGTLTSEILWENLAESYYVRQRGSGGTFTFTPTEIGKYPIRVLVKDSAAIVTEDIIMVTVTGTLPQSNPVQLVINSDTGAGISLSPDGLSAHYTINQKGGVRANQGNYGRFWYFEAQRLVDPGFNIGTGLTVSKGSLNPLDFFTTQPSLEVNFLGSAWQDLVFQANTPSSSGYYGFAVDYRGDHPIVHIIVENVVIYTIELEHVWVPFYPMLYGNPGPGPYDNTINFGATAFHNDPATALTNAAISTTGFQPYWGDANAP